MTKLQNPNSQLSSSLLTKEVWVWLWQAACRTLDKNSWQELLTRTLDRTILVVHCAQWLAATSFLLFDRWNEAVVHPVSFDACWTSARAWGVLSFLLNVMTKLQNPNSQLSSSLLTKEVWVWLWQAACRTLDKNSWQELLTRTLDRTILVVHCAQWLAATSFLLFDRWNEAVVHPVSFDACWTSARAWGVLSFLLNVMTKLQNPNSQLRSSLLTKEVWVWLWQASCRTLDKNFWRRLAVWSCCM